MDSTFTSLPLPTLVCSPSFTGAGSESIATCSSTSTIAPLLSTRRSLLWPSTIISAIHLAVLSFFRKAANGRSLALSCNRLFDCSGKIGTLDLFLLRHRARDRQNERSNNKWVHTRNTHEPCLPLAHVQSLNTLGKR